VQRGDYSCAANGIEEVWKQKMIQRINCPPIELLDMPRAALMPMKNGDDQISLIPLVLSLPFEKSCTNLKPVHREIVRLTPREEAYLVHAN